MNRIVENLKKHWAINALILVVAVIVACFLFAFQVDENEVVVVTRFGKPQINRDVTPGLCLRLPYPIEEIWRHDKRIQMYPSLDPSNPTQGELEEVSTKDKTNIVVTVYLTWTILQQNDAAQTAKNTLKYMESVNDLATAREHINKLVRGAKTAVFGNHSFSELVNTDPQELGIAAIEKELLNNIKEKARELYAIDIRELGISHIGLPESTTEKVFERMKAERQREADRIKAKGEATAAKIRAQADREKQEIISTAEREAQSIQAEGDKLAGEDYKTFSENPELSLFLRQLKALKTVEGKKTYLILDTTTPPLNLMTMETLRSLQNNKLRTPSANPTLKKKRKKIQ